MTMLLLFTVVYIYFIISDLYPLYKEKKSFWLSLSIMAIAYALCVLLAFKVKMPSPVDPIKKMIVGIFGQ